MTGEAVKRTADFDFGEMKKIWREMISFELDLRETLSRARGTRRRANLSPSLQIRPDDLIS